jgi:hypothetical protein
MRFSSFLVPATADDVATATSLIKGITGKFGEVVHDEGAPLMIKVRLEPSQQDTLRLAVETINEQAVMPVLEMR